MVQSLLAGAVSTSEARLVRDLVDELPDGSALAVMLEGLVQAAMDGDDITMYTSDQDLTTAQAAKILNVSRPFVTKLMDEGLLAFHMVGSHHRCSMRDVQDYISRREAAAADIARAIHAPAHVQGEYMELTGSLPADVNEELADLGFPPVED